MSGCPDSRSRRLIFVTAFGQSDAPRTRRQGAGVTGTRCVRGRGCNISYRLPSRSVCEQTAKIVAVRGMSTPLVLSLPLSHSFSPCHQRPTCEEECSTPMDDSCACTGLTDRSQTAETTSTKTWSFIGTSASSVVHPFKIPNRRRIAGDAPKTLQWLAQTLPAALRDCHRHR